MPIYISPQGGTWGVFFVFRAVGTLARIVFGWALASMAAGLVTVLFVDIDVLTGGLDRLPKTLSETIDLALLAATHIAIFSSVFVLITALIAEWFSLRALSFYLAVGVAIALLGFSAQYASEVTGQATIFNNYAIKTFLTVGLIGGFVYWLGAGQFAGRLPAPSVPGDERPEDETAEIIRENKEDPTEVVITRPPQPDEEQRWRMPKLERLRFAKRDGETISSALDTPSSSDEDDTKPPRD